MNPDLLRQVKLLSLLEDKQIDQILAEALELYRRERVAAGGGCAGQMVADSWGALRLERDLVLSLMEDEDGLFEA
ncbi:MAG: hypothetical protein GY856_26700 [bacterium]|nr:hypothetical protein [bacterium]